MTVTRGTDDIIGFFTKMGKQYTKLKTLNTATNTTNNTHTCTSNTTEHNINRDETGEKASLQS